MTVHRTVEDFLRSAEAFLRSRYADNNAMLGVCEAVRGDRERGASAYFFSCSVGGAVVGAAVRTPPHNLLVTPMDAAYMEGFVAEIHSVDPDCPGVTGDLRTAEAFAAAWRRLRPESVPTRLLTQGVYELRTVLATPPVSGVFRRGEASHDALLAEWGRAFAVDAGLPAYEHEHVSLRVRALLEMGNVGLWCDPQPVAMAAFVPVDSRSSRVSFVYTPAAHRGRGYATAVVSALTRQLLAGGNERCFLFTDLENPTSNAIYQRVGYRKMGEGALWRFDGAT